MKAGGDLLVDRGIQEQVAGNLVDHELIERHVRVERANQPVAIGPIVADLIRLVPVAVGVASQVEPRQRPPLAVVLGGEQPVDHSLVSVRRRVVDEPFDFFGRRWQPDQRQRYAPNQSRPIGRRRRLEPRVLQAAKNEMVDRRGLGNRLRELGHSGAHDRAIGPVRRLGQFVGPRCSLVDPPSQRLDFTLGQPPPIERHQIAARFVGQPLDEQAVERTMLDDDRLAGIGPAIYRLAAVELQGGLLLFRPMTAKAIAAQDRLHVVHEINRVRRA